MTIDKVVRPEFDPDQGPEAVPHETEKVFYDRKSKVYRTPDGMAVADEDGLPYDLGGEI